MTGDLGSPFVPGIGTVDPHAASARRPRVVWADDNPDMRDYVARLLTPSCDVEAVSDAHAALVAIQRDIPDLVLADVMLPGLNGVQLLRAIRSDPTTADTPVVLLSARGGEGDHIEDIEAVADDYLIKPFSVRELHARVNTHVKLGRLRRELRAAQQRNEARLRRLMNVEGVCLLLFQEDGTLIDANDEFLRMFGYTREQVTAHGLTWRDMTPAEHVAVSEAQMERLRETGRIGPYEKEYLRRDGSRSWMVFAGATLGDGTIVEYCIDVSDRKRTDEALRTSEQHLRLAMRSGGMYLWDIDIATGDTQFSDNVNEVLRFPMDQESADVLARIDRLIVPEDRERQREAALRAMRGEAEFHEVTRIVDPHSGDTLWIEGHGAVIRDADGIPRRLVGVGMNITDRKHREEDLRRLNDELETRVRTRTAEIQALFGRLVNVQEYERRRIARDVHDQLGQQMTALRMNLDALREHGIGNPNLLAQIERTEKLAEELDRSIDFLTWELRPAALEHGGLAGALDQLAQSWSQRFGITAEFVASIPGSVRLTPEAETHLYRLAQEALNNIAKHAAASHVSIVLRRERQREQLLLIIEDDGRGFDIDRLPARSSQGGLGLVSMRERAALAGGELTIESAPAQGTSLFVRAPLTRTGSAGHEQ